MIGPKEEHMKFSCNSSELQKSITIVEKAISPRTSLPILENIFFELKNGRLRLRGNDLEIGIDYSMPVEKAESDGAILLKAKTISNIISKIPNQNLTIQADSQNKVIIKADQRLDFDILGTSADDYPEFPGIENGVRLTLTCADLRELIRHTIFAVSFDETKQFLNGILIKNEDNVLFFVATDGYRLSLKKKQIKTPDQDFSAIIPHKAMNEVQKILQNVAEGTEITLNISKNQVAFSMDNFLFVTRVIQGQFPDYRQVIPANSANAFSVPRRYFFDACERASIISSASNNVARLSFNDNHLIIKANAASLGEFREDIDIKRLKGSGETRIAFNVRLLIDAIKHMDMDDIKMEFNNELSPCIIRPLTGEEYLYIIMPIRTSDYQANEEKKEVVTT